MRARNGQATSSRIMPRRPACSSLSSLLSVVACSIKARSLERSYLTGAFGARPDRLSCVLQFIEALRGLAVSRRKIIPPSRLEWTPVHDVDGRCKILYTIVVSTDCGIQQVFFP